MKNLILLLSLFSCNPYRAIDETKFSHPIPKTFVKGTDQNITFKNDTVYFNNQKYSGFIFELQSNNLDTLYIKGYYKGLQGGLSKIWNEKHKLIEVRSYINGKKNGKQTAFWNNGNKKFEFVAYQDAYEGEMKEWKSDGQLIHLANYKDGQEEGIQKLWYDDGKIRANFVILKGKRYGLLGTKNCKNVSDSIFIVK